MHDIYCLQLERFLCRECGKVKCSCNLTPYVAVREDTLRKTEETAVSDAEPVQLRRPEFTRQLSESENQLSQKPPLPLSYRASEQPFSRSSQSENGKLRRSFAVRSREGLENLLNTIRKSPDNSKTKSSVRQQ